MKIKDLTKILNKNLDPNDECNGKLYCHPYCVSLPIKKEIEISQKVKNSLGNVINKKITKEKK